MQSLLADEGTKNELVTYLAKKTLALCESESNRHKKAYVTADEETKNNFKKNIVPDIHSAILNFSSILDLRDVQQVDLSRPCTY
jgi:hypothetical protein